MNKKVVGVVIVMLVLIGLYYAFSGSGGVSGEIASDGTVVFSLGVMVIGLLQVITGIIPR